jgi:alpha-ribazole phosphatase/probable phosphoglycerate mutase
MTVTRLYLIRHGQVTGHDDGRINGQTDVRLTPHGEAQAKAVAQSIADVSLQAVYSSDLFRADFGASCVTSGRDIRHKRSSALRELHFGKWEQCTHDQVMNMERDSMDNLFSNLIYHASPGGESISNMFDRVMGYVRSLLSLNNGNNICIVAHSGVNRVILSDALCKKPDMFWKIDQSYGCLNIIDYGLSNGPVIRCMNRENPLEKGLNR